MFAIYEGKCQICGSKLLSNESTCLGTLGGEYLNFVCKDCKSELVKIFNAKRSELEKENSENDNVL